MKNPYIVFNQKVMGYLCFRGFMLKKIEPNIKEPKKNVFIFNDTEALRKAISEYDTFVDQNQLWIFKDCK